MTFIVSLLASLVAILVYFNSSRISSERSRLIIRAITILIGCITGLVAVFRMLVIVPPGNVGVVNFFGNVSDNILDPGIHIVNPFTNIVNFSTRLKDVKENLDSTSQEGLSLNLDVTLQYKLDPKKRSDARAHLHEERTPQPIFIKSLRHTQSSSANRDLRHKPIFIRSWRYAQRQATGESHPTTQPHHRIIHPLPPVVQRLPKTGRAQRVRKQGNLSQPRNARTLWATARVPRV